MHPWCPIIPVNLLTIIIKKNFSVLSNFPWNPWVAILISWGPGPTRSGDTISKRAKWEERFLWSSYPQDLLYQEPPKWKCTLCVWVGFDMAKIVLTQLKVKDTHLSSLSSIHMCSVGKLYNYLVFHLFLKDFMTIDVLYTLYIYRL